MSCWGQGLFPPERCYSRDDRRQKPIQVEQQRGRQVTPNDGRSWFASVCSALHAHDKAQELLATTVETASTPTPFGTKVNLSNPKTPSYITAVRH